MKHTGLSTVRFAVGDDPDKPDDTTPAWKVAFERRYGDCEIHILTRAQARALHTWLAIVLEVAPEPRKRKRRALTSPDSTDSSEK